MDLIQSCEDVCYVRCNSCTTILTVEIPRNRLMSETAVTIQCGHCTNTSILTTAKPQIVHQEQLYDDHYEPSLHLQTFCSEFKKGQHRDVPPSPSSSSTSSKPSSPSVVNKPPEKKRRLPSVFNLFMKDEIKRIKAANPEIPHQEAFRAAAKNWARSSTPQRICFQQQ